MSVFVFLGHIRLGGTIGDRARKFWHFRLVAAFIYSSGGGFRLFAAFIYSSGRRFDRAFIFEPPVKTIIRLGGANSFVRFAGISCDRPIDRAFIFEGRAPSHELYMARGCCHQQPLAIYSSGAQKIVEIWHIQLFSVSFPGFSFFRFGGPFFCELLGTSDRAAPNPEKAQRRGAARGLANSFEPRFY